MNDRIADAQTVAIFQAGDHTVFDLLVLKYQHRIARVLARRVRDRDSIEDLCQETFINAYRGLGKFRNESSFYTWLCRIAINVANNHAVSRARQPMTDPIEQLTVDAVDMARLSGHTPEHELLSEQLEQVVACAMDALQPDIKDAIALREYEGLAYNEISEVLQCPIGTVRSRIFRAREAIGKAVEEALSGEIKR